MSRDLEEYFKPLIQRVPQSIRETCPLPEGYRWADNEEFYECSGYAGGIQYFESPKGMGSAHWYWYAFPADIGERFVTVSQKEIYLDIEEAKKMTPHDIFYFLYIQFLMGVEHD